MAKLKINKETYEAYLVIGDLIKELLATEQFQMVIKRSKETTERVTKIASIIGEHNKFLKGVQPFIPLAESRLSVLEKELQALRSTNEAQNTRLREVIKQNDLLLLQNKIYRIPIEILLMVLIVINIIISFFK